MQRYLTEKYLMPHPLQFPDKITGQAIAVFFVAYNKSDIISESDISEHISEKIGKVARPKFVFQISDLPKTRTGKVMRRLLKSKLLGEDLGDLSSLENLHVLDEVRSERLS